MSGHGGDQLIDEAMATALMGYANQIDPRVEVTSANADVWCKALRGGTYSIARQVIVDYYRKYDPKSPSMDKITPGYIRHTAIQQRGYQQRRESASRQIEPRKGRKMPRHILRKLQAKGILTDRNPEDYPQ